MRGAVWESPRKNELQIVEIKTPCVLEGKSDDSDALDVPVAVHGGISSIAGDRVFKLPEVVQGTTGSTAQPSTAKVQERRIAPYPTAARRLSLIHAAEAAIQPLSFWLGGWSGEW